MAALTFTIPDAALTRLDAYAKSLGFADFKAYAVDWMKEQAKYLKRLDNHTTATTLVGTDPTPPNIT